MYQASILGSISRLLRNKNKRSELMLAGIFIVLLSNCIQPPEITSFNSANTLLWLGLLTFLYGLASRSNGNNENDRESSIAGRKRKKNKPSKRQ